MQQIVYYPYVNSLEYKVKFNSDKSHITVCSNACIVPRSDFVINGQVISLHNSVTHSGHNIGNIECKKSVIYEGISDLFTRNKFILSQFASCDSNVRNYLFQTYCTSYYVPLRFGVCEISIIKDFIVTGENLFDVFGMFLETHIVDFWSFCMVGKLLKYSYYQGFNFFTFAL